MKFFSPFFTVFIHKIRTDSVISLKDKVLTKELDVLFRAKGQDGIGQDINLRSLGPIAVCSQFSLSTIGGQQLNTKNFAHPFCYMYILKSSSRGSEDFSIGFQHNAAGRRREFCNFKDD